MKQTKLKIRTTKKICYLEDLTTEETNRCNQICNLGFSKGGHRDFMISMSNPIVSILYHSNLIIGVCFANIERKSVMKPLSSEYLYLHTICIDPQFRGNGLCYNLVQNLLTAKLSIGSKVKHLGKSMNMYLHVCTNSDKPNIPAIKCYQRNGFNLIDMMNSEREDGTNTIMIRKKNPIKKTHKGPIKTKK